MEANFPSIIKKCFGTESCEDEKDDKTPNREFGKTCPMTWRKKIISTGLITSLYVIRVAENLTEVEVFQYASKEI